jgi:hypothetical protein
VEARFQYQFDAKNVSRAWLFLWNPSDSVPLDSLSG